LIEQDLNHRAEFFSRTLSLFNDKLLHKAEELRFTVANRQIVLHVAGDGVGAFISRALVSFSNCNLSQFESQVCNQKNTLHLFVWDSASTNTPIPLAPTSVDNFTPLGQIKGWSEGRYLAAYEADAGTLSLLDSDAGIGIYCIRDAAKLPSYVFATPLRSILQWWMRAAALELVHGAAVGSADGAALLVGPGGSGKSNTALSCVESGMKYLGDDYCLVTEDSKSIPSPHVFSVYSSAKLFQEDRTFFPILCSNQKSSKVMDDSNDKEVLFLSDSNSSCLISHAPLRCILVMKVTSAAKSKLDVCSEKEAFLAIAENTSSLLPYAGAKSLKRLGSLVKAVPCFRLELGRDGREQAAHIISELIQNPKLEKECCNQL